MKLLKITVSRKKALRHSVVDYVLLLESDHAFLFYEGREVEVFTYRGRECFHPEFAKSMRKAYSGTEALFLNCFANNLYLSFFYPIYKRMEVVETVLRLYKVDRVRIIDKVLTPAQFPLTGAEGDNTYKLTWDARYVLKYIVDGLLQSHVAVEYKAARAIKGAARKYVVYVLKVLVVVVEIILSKLLSKKLDRLDELYVVRDERTIAELEIPVSSPILFNPSFRCFKKPSQLFSFYRRSVQLSLRLVSKSKLYERFSLKTSHHYIPGVGKVDALLLADSIYYEHFDKICYYFAAEGLVGRVERVITPEFISSIGFLESVAWNDKLRLESVQTFALDRSRVANLPPVYIRTYSSEYDRESFSDIENAVFSKVKCVNFNPVNVERTLAHIGVLTQPNFNIDTGLGGILDELTSFGIRNGIKVSVRIHPRDFSDYSKYQDLIDHTYSADDYLKKCDLIVVKTTSMIDAALRYGIPFITFAGNEADRISYMRFVEARVSSISTLLELCGSYSDFLKVYRGFQFQYFNANEKLMNHD